MQGIAVVALSDINVLFSAKYKVITILRYTLHTYGRADGKAFLGEDVGKEMDLIGKEWTDPPDGKKEVVCHCR